MKLRLLFVTALLVACAPAALAPIDASTDGAPPVPPPAPSGDAGADASRPSSSPHMGANAFAGGVTFRTWAPHATAAFVDGDFPGAPLAMEKEPGGVWALTVGAARVGTAYRFAFDSPIGRIVRTDPYCREIEPTFGCKVIDPSVYPWKSALAKRPARNEAVVYELHVGSFAAPPNGPGTLALAKAKLADLADLGVNVVELMPVQAFGGGPTGWGYNPQLYFAPKPSYGTADDLRAFVDEAHAHGIAVWLDIVVNHMDGWRKAPLSCFDGHCPDPAWGIHFFPPGPYATTPWGPRPYFSEPQVSAMLLGAARQWLDEFRGDGFRWDSVSNIRAVDGSGTTPGGRELLVAANDLTHQRGALSVAEDLKGYAPLTQPPSAGGFGFDAQWDGFGYDVANLVVPPSDDGRDLGIVQSYLFGGYAGDGFARLLFTENHDTVGNGGARLPVRIDAAQPESFAARRRSMLAAVLLMTTPGIPMLFMGQEHLATQGFPSQPAPLPPPTPNGALIRAFYKDMIVLRRNLGGKSGSLLEPGVDVLHRSDANKVIAYRRRGPSGEDVLVILNFRNKSYAQYNFGVPSQGGWRVRLDTAWKAYGADFDGGQTGTIQTLPMPWDQQPYTLPVKLGAYGAVVLTR
jgi:1,4-alpha-glucan branching enzyme